MSRPSKPVGEVAVKAPQRIEVNGALVAPHHLHDFLLAGGVMSRIEGLIHQREPIVRPRLGRSTIGRWQLRLRGET